MSVMPAAENGTDRPHPNRHALQVLSICVFVLIALSGCRRQEQTIEPPKSLEPPNVILISVDTLRRDHLGCYGYGRPASPNIDQLARSGTVFENAVSTCSWTLPAHSSMLTGLYPAFHGLQDDGTKLAPAIPTLPQALQKLGYHTLAVVSHVYVSSQFGLERGFDVFDDSLIEGGAKNPIAEQVVDRFLSRMSDLPREERFFSFVHFFDPHLDYSPPPPFDTRFTDPAYTGPIEGTITSMLKYFDPNVPMTKADLRQAIGYYDGEIAYLDAEIGRLLRILKQRGRLENTVIVFTSDHGEEFKEHRQLSHGKTLFGEQLRVPLIVAGHHSFPPGTRRAGDLVSAVDLTPTLLELAGAIALPNTQGVSLLRASPDHSRAVFAESIRFGQEMRMARQGRFKLIHYIQNDRRLFYDLLADPREQRPFKQDPTGGKLSTELAQYAAAADSGWHLKLIAWTSDPMRCRAIIRTAGRIVNPRHYFSDGVLGRRVQFSRFKLQPDGKELTFDVVVSSSLSEVVFETDPPDVPVTFKIKVESHAEGTGVFLGRDKAIPSHEPFTLVRSDPRLASAPGEYAKAATGCYIRAVIGPAASAPKTNLSPEAIDRLKSLGYTGADDSENP